MVSSTLVSNESRNFNISSFLWWSLLFSSILSSVNATIIDSFICVKTFLSCIYMFILNLFVLFTQLYHKQNDIARLCTDFWFNIRQNIVWSTEWVGIRKLLFKSLAIKLCFIFILSHIWRKVLDPVYALFTTCPKLLRWRVIGFEQVHGDYWN